MKYICLGYIEPGKFEAMTEDERHRTFDECFEYNDHLRANGHLVAEVPLQPPVTALTLYWKNGKVMTTDGPMRKPQEQLGGIQILEARDLNHAVQLISQLPGLKYGLGPVEIRPVADMTEIINESEQRRR
ncbi:MAG: YciI family protein [Candidatus Sulfotelmatobacter sp.]